MVDGSHTQLGERFHVYARRAKLLRDCGFVERRVAVCVLSTWANVSARETLFPSLRRIISDASWYDNVDTARVLVQLVSPSVTAFTLIELEDAKFSEEELAHLRKACVNLTHLDFGGTRDSNQSDVETLVASLVGSSYNLERVDVFGSFPIAQVSHLGLCHRLSKLDIGLRGLSLPALPSGSFAHLKELSLTDMSSGLLAVQFCLALPSTLRMTSFKYTTRYLDPRKLDLLFRHVVNWKTLTTVTVAVYPDDAQNAQSNRMLYDDYAALFQHMHALPQLRTLRWRSETEVFIDEQVVAQLVQSCLQLEVWTMISSSEWCEEDALVSFQWLIDILRDRPSIQELPVRVSCRTLPSLESATVATGSNSAYNAILNISDIDDPTTLAALIEKTLPGVRRCSYAAEEGEQGPSYEKVEEVNRILRNSCS
jgi:hypothetical protein